MASSLPPHINIALLTGENWLPSLASAGPMSYAAHFPDLDHALNFKGAGSRHNDALDEAPLPELHIPLDPMADPLEMMGFCQMMVARAVERAPSVSQRRFGLKAMGDLARRQIILLKRRAKRGDAEAFEELDAIASYAVGMLREVIGGHPEQAKAFYRKEPQMPFIISRNKGVYAEAEALMEQVELGRDYFIRFIPPAERQKGRRKVKSDDGGKVGIKGTGDIVALMRPLLAHVEMLRREFPKLEEPVPAAVAKLRQLEPLQTANINEWVEALYAWMEFMTGNAAHAHPLLEPLGRSSVPHHLAHPDRANHFLRVKRVGRRVRDPKAAYIRRGVKKRMAEWLRDNLMG